MNSKTINKIFETLHKTITNPKTELNYSTPFELLIAVILSANNTDVGVNKVTAKLFPIANTPEKILALGITKLKQQLKTIGLYNNKAKYIMATCAQLVTMYNSQIPNQRDQLETLPGVGRKTANVILNIVFHQPTIAVDTHIFRVCNRTGLAPGKTPLAVEQRLLPVVPKQYLNDAHHLLLLHGRYVCTARKPHCQQCAINKFCEYLAKEK